MPGASKFEAVASIKSFLILYILISSVVLGTLFFFGDVREEIRASVVFFASVRQMPRGYNLLFSLSVPFASNLYLAPTTPSEKIIQNH